MPKDRDKRRDEAGAAHRTERYADHDGMQEDRELQELDFPKRSLVRESAKSLVVEGRGIFGQRDLVGMRMRMREVSSFALVTSDDASGIEVDLCLISLIRV